MMSEREAMDRLIEAGAIEIIDVTVTEVREDGERCELSPEGPELELPAPDVTTIRIDAYAAADREWAKAQTAYDRGDFDALDYGYDRAYNAALAVALRFGLDEDAATGLATGAAAGEEDAI